MAKRNEFPYSGNLALTGLCYSDIAEVRLVFSERRHNLWLAQWQGRSKRDPEELREIQEKMYKEMNDTTRIGRCNRILEACRDVEDEIQAALAST